MPQTVYMQTNIHTHIHTEHVGKTRSKIIKGEIETHGEQQNKIKRRKRTTGGILRDCGAESAGYGGRLEGYSGILGLHLSGIGGRRGHEEEEDDEEEEDED